MSLTDLHISYAAIAAANGAQSSTTATANRMSFFHQENSLHGAAAAAAAAAALTHNQNYSTAHYQAAPYPYLNYHHHSHGSQFSSALPQRQPFAIHEILGLGNNNLTTPYDNLFANKISSGNHHHIYYPNGTSDSYSLTESSKATDMTRTLKIRNDTTTAVMAAAAYGAYLERRNDFLVNFQNTSQAIEANTTTVHKANSLPLDPSENTDIDDNSQSDDSQGKRLE
jgi:hypothetical protein